MTLLKNQNILITGGASGIGRASAMTIAKDGAHVIIADLSPGTEVVEAIRSAGGSAECHELDVTCEGDVRTLVRDVVTRRGALNGAFNNAGIEGPTAKIVDLSFEDWERVIRINLTGVFTCMKCEIEQMSEQDNGGSIVSTASIAGLIGLAGAPAYNAAKHGVIGLTKTCALEYASKNIRVNAVCPGFIDTPMLDRVTSASAQIRDRLIGAIPQRRVAQPEEIADVVAWLLSARSSYMNGAALPVDGGWVAQ